jgi:sarcosine oxidase subunit beta
VSVDAHYDVLVLGGGVIGTAILHELSTRGVRAALLERGMVGGGCTAHSGGVVRVFHANDASSDLAAEGHAYYLDFERHTGEAAAFHRTGFLFFPATGAEQDCRDRVSRLAARTPMRWLDAESVRAEFPEIRAPSAAVFEPGAGYMSPPLVTQAFARAAVRRGAHLIVGTPVRKLVRLPGRLAGVETSHGLVQADRIVVALGAHTPAFLDRHGIVHRLWAQRIQVDARRVDKRTPHPAWIDDLNDLNGRPHEDDQFLIGYPTHERGMADDDASATMAHSELIEHVGRRRFDWMDSSRRVGSFSSFDCYSDGGGGIAGFVDDERTLAVVSGFSGGGFKLAPALARRICNELLKG